MRRSFAKRRAKGTREKYDPLYRRTLSARRSKLAEVSAATPQWAAQQDDNTACRCSFVSRLLVQANVYAIDHRNSDWRDAQALREIDTDAQYRTQMREFERDRPRVRQSCCRCRPSRLQRSMSSLKEHKVGRSIAFMRQQCERPSFRPRVTTRLHLNCMRAQAIVMPCVVAS